jgi:hypothetical protein
MPKIFHLKHPDSLLEVTEKKYYIETAGCKKLHMSKNYRDHARI